MKSKLLLLAISLFALSCNSKDPETEQETLPTRVEVTAIPSGELDTDSDQEVDYDANQTAPTEYLEWSSVKINNLLSLDTNRRKVEALFGKADSTLTPDYDNVCHNCHFCTAEMPAFKEVYYKGVEFEQLGDSLVFWAADLSVNKSVFLQSGNMRLDHKTTLEEVAKLFPEAVAYK
jgi:hypothetical protein